MIDERTKKVLQTIIKHCNIINETKNFFGNNLFIKDLSRKLFFYNYNKKINQFVKGISQIDSIQDYELFFHTTTSVSQSLCFINLELNLVSFHRFF